jgi:hypothetical protein
MKKIGIGMVVLLVGCASAGLNLKQNAVAALQISETALAGAQDLERSLCFTAPATESGPTCTSPTAAMAGLTSARHVQLALLFGKAFKSEIDAATALQTWKSGDPAPSTVAQYQADITATLDAAHMLLPGTLTQPLVDKIQAAVNAAATVATAVGVK